MTLSESVGGGDLGHLAAHNELHTVFNGPAVVSRIVTTSVTADADDANSIIEVNSSSAQTVTIPANSSVAYEIGTVIIVFGMGTGSVTVAPDSGVTFWAPYGQSGSQELAGQYAEASVRKRDTDIWVVAGDVNVS